MAEPTQSPLVGLADAVVSLLDGLQGPPPAEGHADPTPFACRFVIDRRFAVIADLSALKTSDPPFVHVFPIDDTEAVVGGGATPSVVGDYELDVVIYKRVGIGAAAETLCEQLMLLRAQIRAAIYGQMFSLNGPRIGRAVRKGVDGSPAYNQQQLKLMQTFVSPQTFQFAVAG